MVLARLQFHSFACGYHCLAPFVKKKKKKKKKTTILPASNGLGTIVQNHLKMYAGVQCWAFYAIAMSVLYHYHVLLIIVAL